MNEENKPFTSGVGETIPPIDPKPKKEKRKKEKKVIPLTMGKLSLILAVCLIVSFVSGIGGAFLIKGWNDNSVIYQDTSQGTTNVSANESGSVGAVAEKCANSVVEIQTESVTNGNNLFQQYISSGAGSGVIITKDGYIVTNNHVIDGATKIVVRTRAGEEYSAKVIGADAQSDLAVLKIDADDLTPAVLGDSTKLKVGDLAVVIGNPLGELGGTVTSGIISALDREMTIDGTTMTLLQTSAAVNPGNSGGGLFDANGNLVGIINAKSTGSDVEGIGFAIPISHAKDIIDELMKNGEVTSRPTLGVSLYDVADQNTAAQLGVKETGVYIVQIVQGGAADKAGLQVGDRILSADGKEVNTASEVKAQLATHKTSEKMTMEVQRDDKTLEVMVAL